MKVLFYIGSVYKGGAERVVSNLSNYLSYDNEVGVIINKSEKSSYSFNPRVNVISLDAQRYGNFITRNIGTLISLKKVLNNQKPDLVVCFLNNPTMKALFLKKFHLIDKNIKVVVSVRNDPKKIYHNVIKKWLMFLLFKKASKFVFQTDEAQSFFSQEIQKRSIVIPNPINEDFLIEPYSGKREKCIVSVGRLVEQKNHKLLLKAFSNLSKKNDEYVLKIFGDGVLKDSLIKYTMELNLSDKVIFMGNVDNIRDEIYKSALFVLTSNYEGMPNALMEAMTIGLPCISTDCPCGGPRFLITNGYNGLLFPVGDEKKLTELMEMVLSNPGFANEIGVNASKLSKTLEPKVINEQWKKFLFDD